MMTRLTAPRAGEIVRADLDCGIEFAADVLPGRNTAALVFRVLVGVADEPLELTGINGLVERTLSKGTKRFTGRSLADAFDALGASWASLSGRQSTIVRVLCLPEFVVEAVGLVAEMLCRPTFPDEACEVAVELARQELRQMEDEPDELINVLINRLTLGPVLGRYPGGEPHTLPRITPEKMREHWQRHYHGGRIQVAAAGPIDAESLARHVDAAFAELASPRREGREPAAFEFRPAREHQHKELEQEYVAITLRGVPKTDPQFPVEQMLLRVLAGGMSGRLFTEVREKLGLVYWVGAWHEQLRGKGIIHLGASTTPERAHKTFDKLLEELGRIAEDLTEAEVERARTGLIAHFQTEDDLTRSRAAGLSDDLFHFGRPVGLAAKLETLRAVTRDDMLTYARRLPRDQLCIATLGPREL
ncbi:MAG: insulinase family protein [Phycisphaerae bacterium]|jgi:predicted Zn-dependent peptidase|nr:insulinase family protein [Phycisphaerae bacterium]